MAPCFSVPKLLKTSQRLHGTAQAEELRQTAKAAAGRCEAAVREMAFAGKHRQRARGLLGVPC